MSKTTEQHFQEFYNEIRHQIEQGTKANFARANQIWAEYEAAEIVRRVNGADELAEQLEEAQSVLIAIYNNKPLPCGLLDCIDSNHASLAAYRGKK